MLFDVIDDVTKFGSVGIFLGLLTCQTLTCWTFGCWDGIFEDDTFCWGFWPFDTTGFFYIIF